MSKQVQKFLLFIIIFFIVPNAAPSLLEAQVGDFPYDDGSHVDLLTVRELNQQGKHLQAVLLIEKSEESGGGTIQPLGDVTAAARSAWALGLIDLARVYWDRVLEHDQCKGLERARALLSRSLMELQEGKLEDARAFAEEGVGFVSRSELRAELWLVIGESLRRSKLHSLAEGYFEKAVAESSYEKKQEALLSLSRVRKSIGKMDGARASLTQIELNSKVTVSALKELALIDLEKGNAGGVLTWIEQGRSSYPSDFATSEVSYTRIKALLAQGLEEEVREELLQLKKEVSESDAWYQLSRGMFEEHLASKSLPTPEAR